MSNTIMKNILWMAAGMAIAGMLMVVNGLLRGEKKQEIVIVPEKVAPVGKDMDWPSCFTNVTKLADGKAFDRFITQFKTGFDKEEKLVWEEALIVLRPYDTEDSSPEELMASYKNYYRAVERVEGVGMPSSGLHTGILFDITELYQWKMFFQLFKKTTGGERQILVDDQNKWMVWRKEHSELVSEASGDGSGAAWFSNIAEDQVEEDRLNELYCFDEPCTEIYRDLKFVTVRCKGKDIPLKHGRLYFDDDGKKVVGRIINPAFCRRVVLGGDIYKFAVLEPDYIFDVGPNCDTYSWACIWKNGRNSANYRLQIDKHIRHLPLFSEERKITSGIQSINVSNTIITITPSKDEKPFAIDIKAENSTSLDLAPED